MTAPKPSYDPPLNSPVTNSNGVASEPYQQYFDRSGKALEKLRQAANAMQELDPGSATAGDVATAWEAFRAKLQEIV
jgi:hypothetical protein